MKKVIALLLVIILCISLFACSKEENEALLLKDRVIGTWVSKYKVVSEDFSMGDVGDEFCYTIKIYKGGTGVIFGYNITTEKVYGKYTLQWELNDDVLNITYTHAGYVEYIGYEYDEEFDTLTSVDGTETYVRES